MAIFKIISSEGEDFGLFEAETEKDALQALAASHGFFDWSEACETGEFDDSTIRVSIAA